jgi:hypothetical protein
MENIFAAISDEQLRANIIDSYVRSSDACREDGMAWYFKAHTLAVELAHVAGISVERMAAIIAVLSPRSAWGTNVKNATRAAYGELSAMRGLGGSIAKARALLDGAPFEDVVKGEKVNAFWQNIYRPASSRAVTIDAWAAGVCAGRRLSNAEMAGLTTVQRRRLVAAYLDVADRLGIQGHQLEAVTWCELRGRSF